jgi:alpha-glucosidase
MLVALAAWPVVPARAGAGRWMLRAPGGDLTADIRLPARGPLQATVRSGGKRVLDTMIGFQSARGRCLPAGLSPTGRTTRRRVVERYVTPAGKRRLHRHVARDLVLRFRGHRNARIRVQLRVARDGFAYRWAVSGAAGASAGEECSGFSAPAGAEAWTQPYTSNYERPYARGPLAGFAPGQLAFPALLRSGDRWALLSESAIERGQPASHLEVRSGKPGVLGVVRPQVGWGPARARTPWRVAIVGSLATIVESDLVDDLAAPARGGDWSWVRPGRVAWSWWADSSSPASVDRQRQYVDFAGRAGWEYVLVDEGWSPAWLPDLVAYAAERGVRLLVWSRWDSLRSAAQRRSAFALWRAWGVAGVKVDFMHSDSPGRLAWYRDMARDAAAQRLVVDFHGSTLPRGLSRTFPNVLTMEAVQGAESYKSDVPAPATPAHNATLPFTRNAVGPMDYTPVTFSAIRRQTTAAHELALSVVFSSGLQHFADSPESYAAVPLAERWLRDVPAAWDETRLLDGYPGAAATIARRSGATWFVGGIRAGAAEEVELPLRFLAPGRTYAAWAIEDSRAGDLVARTAHVTAAQSLRLATQGNGGFVVRFAPVRHG